MLKHFVSLLIVLMVIFAAYGCSDQSGPSSPNNSAAQIAGYYLPDGAVLSTARFNIFVKQGESQAINIHRVTADWQEMTATWNNFGAAFDGTISGSFSPAQPGWYTVDISSLASTWLNGGDNYGFLMDQAQLFAPSTIFNSRENDNIAYLVINYMLNDQPESDTLYPIADTYIDGNNPDENYGGDTLLYTGWPQLTDLELQSLVKFDIGFTAPVVTGCTYGMGYWKNHAGFGPQANEVSQYLPIWLGDAGGTKSLQVTDSSIAHDVLVMKTYGTNSNGITKLYAKLLTAKLNIAGGASGTDVASAISAADAFLADHDWNDWDSLSKSDQQMVLSWKGMFENYNEGIIGPGSCGDEGEDHNGDSEQDEPDED